MASLVSLASLLLKSTKSEIYQKLIDVAKSTGLVVESFQSGDPTRSIFDSVAARWAEWDALIPEVIKGGFLRLAEGDWLTLLLAQNYNVERVEATYATDTIRITNSTSENHGAIDVDDLTFENPVTHATYRNTQAGTLGPLGVLDLDIEAEVAGSGGTSAIGTITGLVTSIPGVTVTNLYGAVGLDRESDDVARARGESKLEALSPAGPKGAYHHVLTTPSFQSDGATNITRTRIIDDDTTGNVGIFVAGASGAVSGADVTKGIATVENWANPFMVNAHVLNTTNLAIAIAYSLWVYDTINLTTGEIEAKVAAALALDFPLRPIGGDIIPPATSGKIFVDWIEARILAAVAPHGFRCTVTTPAADVDLALVFVPAGASTAEVAILGALTPTVSTIAKGGAT